MFLMSWDQKLNHGYIEGYWKIFKCERFQAWSETGGITMSFKTSLICKIGGKEDNQDYADYVILRKKGTDTIEWIREK